MKESHKAFYFDEQPPPSFLATMEEYIKEAPQTGYVNKKVVRKSDVQTPWGKLVVFSVIHALMFVYEL